MVQYPPVWQVVSREWWQMSEHEALQLWHAVRRATWSRATTLRQQLALIGYLRVDKGHLFGECLTSQEVLLTIEDLTKERLLTRKKASVLEERILTVVDNQGAWITAHMRERGESDGHL